MGKGMISILWSYRQTNAIVFESILPSILYTHVPPSYFSLAVPWKQRLIFFLCIHHYEHVSRRKVKLSPSAPAHSSSPAFVFPYFSHDKRNGLSSLNSMQTHVHTNTAESHITPKFPKVFEFQPGFTVCK